MAPRVVQILEAYAQLYKETGKDQPIIVVARYVRCSVSNPTIITCL